MKADLICIGGELLTGLIENSNAGYLSRRLWSAGIPVRRQAVVPDDAAAIAGAVAEALEHSELVICTGGLGPTDDDLTREAVAGLLKRPLQLHREWLAKLERFFSERSLAMPEANRKQAMLIAGGLLVDNPRGTAPGTMIDLTDRLLFLLPGPPHELQPMFEEAILPLLRSRIQGPLSATRTLKCTGLGESLLEDRIRSLGRWEQPALSLVARGQEVLLQLKAHGEPGAVNELLAGAESRLRRVLNGYLYGEDEETLAGVVADAFIRRGLSLALAESCSGGLLSDAITDIPGSSRFYKGAVVAYGLAAKAKLLGIDSGLLAREGAVSEAAAGAMAIGAGELFAADVGVGITGIAGPESDDSGTPVGLVYVAVAWRGRVDCKQLKFIGNRRTVKERAAQSALTILWKTIKKENSEYRIQSTE